MLLRNKVTTVIGITALSISFSFAVHAAPGAPTSGTITVINNLAAHKATAFPGITATPIKVVFRDGETVTAGTPITSTGGVICSTVATVAYGGVTSISWPQTGATSPSTAGKCTKLPLLK